MDDIKEPEYYNWHPEGIECMDVVKYMPFLRGNAMKYLWRAGRKDSAVKDLSKAIRYIEEEIEMILGADNPEPAIDPSTGSRGAAQEDLT